MQYATGVPHGQSVTTAVTTPTVVSWAKKFLSSTMCTTVSAVSSPHDTWDVESDLSSTDGNFTMKNDTELSEDDREEVRKSCTANDTDMKIRVMEQSINMIVFNCSRNCTGGNDCANQPGFISFILDLRDAFWGKPEDPAPPSSRRKQMIRSFLQSAGGYSKNPSNFSFSYTYKKKCYHVCEKIFCSVLGYNRIPDQWIDAKRFVASGSIEEPTARFGQKTEAVKAYMNDYMESKCDVSAFADMEGIKILPFANISEFHREYVADHSDGDARASENLFRTIYRKDFKRILRCMRCKGNHTSCEVRLDNYDYYSGIIKFYQVCINASIILNNGCKSISPNQRTMVAKYRRRHLQLQETERAALDEHTRQCKRDRDPITGWPTKFQIFPDGMTEHTTLTPNVRINGRVSKQDHGKPELSSRVIGARVVCGEIDEFFVYYTDQLVLKDPDITCELIRQSMADLGRLCKDKHNCLLPKEGFFQFDNCPTENKASCFFVNYMFSI